MDLFHRFKGVIMHDVEIGPGRLQFLPEFVRTVEFPLDVYGVAVRLCQSLRLYQEKAEDR